MELILHDDNTIKTLDLIQETLTASHELAGTGLVCDCTSCSDSCTEYCNDGNGSFD